MHSRRSRRSRMGVESKSDGVKKKIHGRSRSTVPLVPLLLASSSNCILLTF